MKPLKLKMQAFGPYVKPTEIDFETGLQGRNFFLIHGATGSGKTTILDAICYAIYGKCSGEKRTGEMMRSEKADVGARTEVDFTFALNGKNYRVIRSPKYWRKSLRSDNYVEEKAAVTIYENDKQVVLDKNEDYFKNLLQFDVNQFRQVVLLPQGEFRKFLMSNSGDRGEILNVIFNADLYKAVEVALKEKAKDAALNFQDIETRRKNLLEEARSLTESDIANFDENAVDAHIEKCIADLKTFNAEIARLKSQADTAAANLSDGKALYADFEKLDKSAKILSDAKIALTDAEKTFDAAQERYEQVKADEPRLRKLDTEISELKKIQGNVEDLQNAQKKLAEAETSELNASNKLVQSKNTKERYEMRLSELKAAVEKFAGADVNYNDAKQKFTDAQEKQLYLDKLASLKKELKAAENRLNVAQKNFDAAKLKLDRLIALQKLCTAAKLAATLKDGEPCPVCGSTVHPHLAVSEEVIPTDDEIERVENILEKRRIEKDMATTAPAKITGRITAIEDALKRYVDTLTVDAAQKFLDESKAAAAKLEDSRERLKKGEEMTQKLYREIEKVTADVTEKSKAAENLRGIVKEKKAQIPADYLTEPEIISADLKARKFERNKLQDEINSAEKSFQSASNQKSRSEGALKTADKNYSDAVAQVKDKEKPDIDALKNLSDAAQKVYVDKKVEADTLDKNLKYLQRISLKLKNLAAELESAEDICNMWKKLSETANGKLSFQRYYLNSMFQHVISEANTRLEKMSGGRYQFRNKEQTHKGRLAGLDLEIFDANSATCRDVATLSGGESFLASLSLALGLSAVVKNTAGGIKLDTIFIDEGFGSLDSETLDYAINTLVDLQSDGRLVGIISHVEELKQRVPNRLEITKHKSGSTAKFI